MTNIHHTHVRMFQNMAVSLVSSVWVRMSPPLPQLPHYNYRIGRRHIVGGECRWWDNQRFLCFHSLPALLATHAHCSSGQWPSSSIAISPTAESEQTFIHCQIDLKIILFFCLRVCAPGAKRAIRIPQWPFSVSAKKGERRREVMHAVNCN